MFCFSAGLLDPSEAVLHQLARALQGLTLDEARYALRRALARGRSLGPESLPAVLEEKRLLVNRSGVTCRSSLTVLAWARAERLTAPMKAIFPLKRLSGRLGARAAE